MQFSKYIQTVDTHTVGQATRVITGGCPPLRGNSMMEKKEYLAAHYDYIRRATMLEPRGHADMFGALLTDPTSPEADMGMIFLDGVNYLNMCGHGTIGVSTVLVETGLVEVSEPYTDIVLEAPAGLIKVKVRVENGRAMEVTFTNVPSFVFSQNVTVDVPELGPITFDFSFGGSFFAIVDHNQFGLDISPQNVDKIIPKAVRFLKYVHENVKVEHPLLPEINTIDLVEIYGPPASSDADCQNMVVLGEGEVDRSPCGTGTCAKLALLHRQNKLGVGEPFIHESVIKTKFRGEIIDETEVGSYPAVVPQITGSAYIMGLNEIVLDDDDPLKCGFILKEK